MKQEENLLNDHKIKIEYSLFSYRNRLDITLKITGRRICGRRIKENYYMRPETFRKNWIFTDKSPYFMNNHRDEELIRLSGLGVEYIGKTKYVPSSVEYNGITHMCSNSVSDLAANGGIVGDENMFAFPCQIVYKRNDRKY